MFAAARVPLVCLLGHATKACHDRFVSDGIDLSAYNAFENIEDFMDLRGLLKVNKWSIFGTFYGTYVYRKLGTDRHYLVQLATAKKFQQCFGSWQVMVMAGPGPSPGSTPGRGAPTARIPGIIGVVAAPSIAASGARQGLWLLSTARPAASPCSTQSSRSNSAES